MTLFLSEGPEDAAIHVLLAHGAGAPMTSPFMDAISCRLAANKLCVHRFEFEYMAQRRSGGARKPPPKVEQLLKSYHDAVAHWTSLYSHSARLFVGGKSLGGRVASLAASDLYKSGLIAGVICLGYPFHPPGQPNKLRTAHLLDALCPTLIVQGSRDPFGTREETVTYAVSKAVKLHWIEDGNHDLIPRASSGRNANEALDEAAAAISRFSETSTSISLSKPTRADGAPLLPGRGQHT